MKTVLLQKYKIVFHLMIFGLLLLTGAATAKPLSGAFIEIDANVQSGPLEPGNRPNE